jgi:hypothetical protein
MAAATHVKEIPHSPSLCIVVTNAAVISNSRLMQANPANIDLYLMHLKWRGL